MSTLTGSCLCGAVRFELDDDFHQFNLCHCKQCQRTTGSAHASNLFTRPGNLQWTQGADLVKRYDVPGRTISSAFCVECGSGLPYVSKSGESLIVPAGSLDTGYRSSPVMGNIFWAERGGWYDAAVSAEHFDEFPD